MMVWIPAVAFGVRTLLRYANTPGEPASPPEVWPADALIHPAEQRFTVLMFAHPRCPCSRASLEELARIVSCCSQRMDATVLFYAPSSMPRNWNRTDLWNNAVAMGKVHVSDDPDGIVARRFGVHTSGQTLVYSADRRLAFNGGVTAFRGHSGDNEGRDQIVDLLLGVRQPRGKSPVFGCAIFSDQ
jgi:hypothetical protein